MTDSGLVVVDKPAGMTSHDVVSRVRREFGTRKVGHAGTLDPMATGVLILGIERGTKFLAHMVTATKAYNATISLGASTTTDDFEGEIISQTSAAHITDAEILSAIANLTGDIMQKPAKVSAIKIDGKRAYQRVRDGEDVDIPARPVTVSRFEVLESRNSPREVDVVVECSSGTYIRSLARDLGEALGVGGHLTALRRTEVGPFSLDDASPLDSMELSLNLDEALVRCYPRLDVTAEESHKLAMGQWLEPRGVKGTYAAVGPDGRSIALVKEKGKRLSTVFVAHPSTL
ncbi:tRNA pseudouridine(55) synthase TruB [Corynebacterium stationis]|uniref:tRNA pseudouridine(55) synthase TruB n=1 Tax=Corynebacterium stationis TaxID=1705 RepID=UPI00076F77F3|nr:tRNA pseudouridine(55) synthase TruB [Corynebacterium stationis]AMJ44442.1 pseudouridine synthase [Corynebacterium stationis]APT94815.1 pseudouridine synthase [Corynebacterium stationis]AQX70900.1 tRNA pseudouridine(55) synthase TruB [Corynebacterium stationis]ASJ18588.1 tRNA pseudouridine(55) synthase TruB [Corynebacterium stationis]HJG64317.1 tRNA pseudouridine(55) synthase TruB [Corynebacterium stationis]